MSRFKFKSSGIRIADDERFQEKITPNPVGISTPLQMGSERSGIFRMHYDVADQIANNFKDLVQTNFGERICNPSYGANLRPLVTEYSNIEDFDSAAMERIQTAVERNLPMVELESFASKFIEDDDPGMLRLNLLVKYNIPKLGVLGRVLNVSFFVI
jgi:phage baseplate assembly protein W